jgi:hypothetical protein
MHALTPTNRVAVVTATAAALLALAACGTADQEADQGPTTAGPSAQQTMSPTKLAVANLLLADGIAPAPPSTVMDTTGPVTVKGVIGEPSRQVMTCTPLELPVLDDPGPAEPDAVGAASSSSVLGVAQVDQYAVVYATPDAAQLAVDRARERAEDCDAAFAVHSPDANAEAEISAAPSTVEGFRVHATYNSENSGTVTDEISAVLRHGATVLYIRANETGSGENADEDVDGALDPTWADQLIDAASAHLAE